MHRHLFTRWIRLTYYFSPTAPTTKCPTSCCHSALFFKRIFFFISTLPRPSPRPATAGSEISSSRIVRQSIEVRRGFSWQTSAFNIGFTTCKMYTLYMYRAVYTPHAAVRQWLLYSANYRAH